MRQPSRSGIEAAQAHVPKVSTVEPYYDFSTSHTAALSAIRNELSAANILGLRMLSRPQQLNYYLGTARDLGEISPHTAQFALSAWIKLSAELRGLLQVPDAATGSEGEVLYSWDRNEHHLELEIFANDKAEFFYLNRVSNETWEDELQPTTPISEPIAEKIALFKLTDD